MDDRPIGVFDSGVGGLTAVRTIMELAPEERIVFFGDTARVPYGERTREEIAALSLQDARFLRAHGPKLLLAACNTITANAIDELRAANPDLPVVGVVETSAAAAVRATKNGRIGVIGTSATVRSGIYETVLRAALPDARLTVRACPKLVPLIEAGRLSRGDGELAAAVEEYLEPVRGAGVDVLVLACTHFPLIRGVIEDYMGGGVTLIDSGDVSALAALERLRDAGALAPSGAAGGLRCYCSGRLAEFERIAEGFLGRPLRGAREIDIGRY